MLTASGVGMTGSLLLGETYTLCKCENAITWNPIPDMQWFNLAGFNKGTKSKNSNEGVKKAFGFVCLTETAEIQFQSHTKAIDFHWL